ncbi:MAG: class I SAM-dependent methyltransferase [Acidimicrobiales bacterium]|nr:class I SAM-dependent methyltransferase [Acidimicrobiales bacterium]
MSDHDHHRNHDHGHGHASDQGVKAMFRYLRWAPQLWRSDINDAVVDLVGPVEGETVLDIGAGLGAGAFRAARAGASVVAVEPTPFLRRLLVIRRIFERERQRITVADGSAEHLPADSQTIDALWAVNTMHHWIDADAAALEMKRVLVPGGRVALVDEDFENPEHPEHERFGANADDHEHHGFTKVDVEQMGDRLRRVGLVDVVASERQLAGRPVIAITARAAAGR